MATKGKEERPVLLLRFTIDGKTYEAEVPGGLVAMKGAKR